MIDGFQLSPSNRAKCSYCDKIIGKDAPRGIENIEGRTYKGVRYYCHKCTLLQMDGHIVWLRHLKIDFKKLIKKSSKALILEKLQETN